MRRAAALALVALLLGAHSARGQVTVIDRINPGAFAGVTHANALRVEDVGRDAVNVFHQSTIRHVSSVSHVQIVGPSYGGTTQAEVKQGAPGSVAPWPVLAHAQQSGSWTVQAAHLAGVPSVSQGTTWSVVAHAQQSGSWTVQAAHQGGQWNVQHVGSVLHVASVVTRATIPCPSSAAVNQTASATVVTGVAAQFVQICSIILVSDTAQNLSVTEGTGVACATGPAALIGGTTASVSVTAQGGFSAVSGVPWLVTKTSGDNLCVLQSGTGNVSGIITYRLTL